MKRAREDGERAEPSAGAREPVLKLSEILGQDRVLAMLDRAVSRGTLHHALLFAGPEGVGKRTTASALAARLLCRRAREDACGECDACVQVAAGTHPDLRRESLPQDEQGRTRDRMTIDQIRSLQVALGGRPLAADRKIAILEEAQTLTEEAQNAFLKTLEEPPGRSLLILVAHNASALRPTVRSRCQTVAFSPLPPAVVERILRQRLGRSAEDARFLAAYSEGSLAFAGDAERLRDAHARVSRLLATARSASYDDVVTAAREVMTSPKGIPLDLRVMVALLRRELRARAGLADGGELASPLQTTSVAAALRAVEAAYAAVVDLARYANRSLAAERLWMAVGESLE